jgi:hypothetical protein
VTPGRGRAGAGAAVTAALALAGCCTTPPAQFPSADAALERMKATYACTNGLHGEGKIDHFGEKGRVRGEVLLFAINPARVRIDIPHSLGVMLYTLTSDGENFKMLDSQEKKFLYGPASACNLARLTQVPLPGHVLVTLLRGEAPLLVHEPGKASIVWDCDHYRVDIPSTQSASQEVHLVPYDDDWDKPWKEQRLKVTQVNVYQRGGTLYTAALGDHQPTHTAGPMKDPDQLEPDIPPSGGACDIEIPHVIHMQVPSTADDVIFRYSKVEMNPPIPPGAFDQPTPGGVQEIPVDCKE